MKILPSYVTIATYLFLTTQAIIGYDCGSRTLNVTTLSLIDVGKCHIPEDTINVTKQYVQLLQLNEYTETKVKQCKLELKRTAYYCGFNSHIMTVKNAYAEYIYSISHSACLQMHHTGMLRFGNHVIQGLKINSTTTHSIVLAGHVNSEGTCYGSAFSDDYGTYENVVVQGHFKITLQQHIARVSIDNDQIHLRSGTTCTLSDETCLDMEGGHTFWKSTPIDNCGYNHYSILFEGYANKMIDQVGGNHQIVYSLATQDITFALTQKSKESLCGYSLTRTEHPKLVIFETVKGDSFASQRKTSVANLDIFAYMNSKFVYVEKHIRTQMKYLYRDVVLQRCELERQTLKNALSIATQAPDEFAYHLMKGPGYMAVVAGEVVHIVKCIPVEVKIEHGENCYMELQVTKHNMTYFMTPRTHILKKTGTRTACNALLPAYYLLGESWYKILPRPTEAIPTTMIKPMSKSTWTYVNPAELATSGIYTEQDLKNLRENIMYPMERQSLLNDVAREIRGEPVTASDGTIFKLLNEDAINKIAQSAWDRAWNKFITFGTFSAGVIAIIMIVRLFKIIVDIVVRGYALHSVFGWSLHLLGAIWSSIAHLLLHLRTTRQENTNQDIERQDNLEPPRKVETKPDEGKLYFSLATAPQP